jgi:hypothetical protein
MHHFTMPIAAACTTHLTILISATHTTHLIATTTTTAAITPQIYDYHHNVTTMTATAT